MKQDGNPIMQGSSGRLGDAVFRQRKGRLIVAKRPKRRTTFTPDQEKVKDKFKDAVYYAKGAVADEAVKAEYAVGVNDKLVSPYLVAFTDYLKAPKIKNIDASLYSGAIGEQIAIRATDDFKVVSVTVELRDSNDVLLESGAAVQNGNAVMWHYTATTANQALAGTKVKVTAKDKPGNMTTENIVL